MFEPFLFAEQSLHLELQPLFLRGQLRQLRSGQSEHLSLFDLIDTKSFPGYKSLEFYLVETLERPALEVVGLSKDRWSPPKPNLYISSRW